MPTIRIKNKTWWYVVVVIVIVIVTAPVLAYGSHWQPLQGLFPAAVVRGSFVSLQTWADTQAVAAKFNPNYNRSAAYDQMIKTEKERQLTWDLRVPVTKADFTAEDAFLKSDHDSEYADVITQYFGDQSRLFINLVIAPRVLDAKLRIKYNSDFNLNSSAYNRAKKILTDLKSGQDFGALAQIVSDDKVTAQLAGDLGFVFMEQLLPEVSEKLGNLPVGTIAEQLVVSRLGYHVLYPMETSQKNGQTVYHIKQILIATSGYDDWLNPQLEKISVWRIVKP